nr:MAG TPA: protein of unknown function DUF2190 [Caudoviricetes sp.]
MAKAIYRRPGDVIEYVPTKAVEYGEVVAFAGCVGVATTAIPAGQPGAVAITGAFEFEKDTKTAIDAGAVVYFNATSGKLVTAADGAVRVGVAAQAAATSDAVVLIKLC